MHAAGIKYRLWGRGIGMGFAEIHSAQRYMKGGGAGGTAACLFCCSRRYGAYTGCRPPNLCK